MILDLLISFILLVIFHTERLLALKAAETSQDVLNDFDDADDKPKATEVCLYLSIFVL